MATTLTEVENTCAWGSVTGRDPKYPIIITDRMHYQAPFPGMLVTSYAGHEHLVKTGVMGLGIIVSVRNHPCPVGDTQFLCLVVWNFDPAAYKS